MHGITQMLLEIRYEIITIKQGPALYINCNVFMLKDIPAYLPRHLLHSIQALNRRVCK
jgi:hypothetical protein